MAARTAEKRDSADRWRSARDRVRVGSQRLAEAAAHLREPGALDRLAAPAQVAASAGGPGGERGANHGVDPAGEGAKHGVDAGLERFYVTASLHGHALIGDVPLAHALRDRAVRILLARALAREGGGGRRRGDGACQSRSGGGSPAGGGDDARTRRQGVRKRLVPQ
ncbi:MAG: hypothetical protein R3F14_00265 [Polyangiaceae bacterium]